MPSASSRFAKVVHWPWNPLVLATVICLILACGIFGISAKFYDGYKISSNDVILKAMKKIPNGTGVSFSDRLG